MYPRAFGPPGAVLLAGGCGRLGLRRGAHPGTEVEGVDADAEEVGGNETELRGAQADEADDDAVDAGHHEARPVFACNQNGGQNGEKAGQVVET